MTPSPPDKYALYKALGTAALIDLCIVIALHWLAN